MAPLHKTAIYTIGFAICASLASPGFANGKREPQKTAPAYTTYQWVKPRAKAAKTRMPSHIARHMRFASAMRHGNTSLSCSPSGSGMLSKCATR